MTEVTCPRCIECGTDLPWSRAHRLYCSGRCKARWRKIHGPIGKVSAHECRVCGVTFQIVGGQGNKWLCSDQCRRASNARSVRNFHVRRPQQEAVYRARAKDKKLPDSNLVRFYRTNKCAPRACESCGETRVLDVAHKPTHPRLGAWRSSVNCKWPEMVWVLCPTCHALLDRMNYSPRELGLELL